MTAAALDLVRAAEAAGARLEARLWCDAPDRLAAELRDALAALRDLAEGPDDRAEAQYWFVRGSDRGKRIEVALDDATTERYAAALGRLVDGIAGGLFPGKVGKDPGYAFVECPWCTPDGVGHAEARETYVRKRSEPALRDLMRLIDPDAVSPDPSDAGSDDGGAS